MASSNVQGIRSQLDNVSLQPWPLPQVLSPCRCHVDFTTYLYVHSSSDPWLVYTQIVKENISYRYPLPWRLLEQGKRKRMKNDTTGLVPDMLAPSSNISRYDINRRPSLAWDHTQTLLSRHLSAVRLHDMFLTQAVGLGGETASSNHWVLIPKFKPQVRIQDNVLYVICTLKSPSQFLTSSRHSTTEEKIPSYTESPGIVIWCGCTQMSQHLIDRMKREVERP